MSTSDEIKMCETAETEEITREESYGLIEMIESQEQTKCLHKCRRTVWKVKVTKEPSTGIDHGNAMLYIDSSMKSEHSEDVLIYDINTVIASVGGSLGLFLGVSCFSLFTYMGRAFSRRHRFKKLKLHPYKSDKTGNTSL